MLPAQLLSMAYATGLALLAFSAVYQPQALGPLAASPGMLLIALCTLMLPLTHVRRSRLATFLRVRQLLWLGLATSVLSLGLFGWSALYAAKFVSLAVITLVWLSPLLMLDVLRVAHIRRAAATGIAICLVGYLVSDLFPSALPGFLRQLLFNEIFSDYGDGRARGFTEEPSHFSTLMARLMFIYYVIWEARRPYSGPRLIAVLCGMALALVALGSRGAVAGIVIAILSVSAGRKQLGYLVLLLPLAAWIAASQLDTIIVDVEQFTSTSTRLGMSLTGLAASLLNPLGYGYYGFYGAVQHFGIWSMEWLSARLPLIFTEMADIVEELNNVSTKSTVLDFTMIFGWPFLLLLRRIVKLIDIKDPRARATLVYLAITAFSTSSNLSVIFFLGLVALMKSFPSPYARRLLASRPVRSKPSHPPQGVPALL